jgi:hypothetical protein
VLSSQATPCITFAGSIRATSEPDQSDIVLPVAEADDMENRSPEADRLALKV